MLLYWFELEVTGVVVMVEVRSAHLWSVFLKVQRTGGLNMECEGKEE